MEHGIVSVEVSESQYGEVWPFTVASGILICIPGEPEVPDQCQIVFLSNGKRYAINGTAIAYGIYSSVEDIWRFHPDIQGIRMSLRPIIDRALALYREAHQEQLDASAERSPRYGSIEAMLEMSWLSGGSLIHLVERNPDGEPIALIAVLKGTPGNTLLNQLIAAINDIYNRHTRGS